MANKNLISAGSADEYVTEDEIFMTDTGLVGTGSSSDLDVGASIDADLDSKWDGNVNSETELKVANGCDLVSFIANTEKRTPVKVYIKENSFVEFGLCRVFGIGDKIVFGDWADIKPIIDANVDKIDDYIVEGNCRNSAIPLLDMKDVKARIEPGALIREGVKIGENSVIMMGAVINIGSVIGACSMIDMGAVLGGGVIVGRNCHIGAGTVLAGIVEPSSEKPVIIGDNVIIGANAVVLEGCRVGKGAVVAAGAVVVTDVPDGKVVAGVPAKIIKSASDIDAGKINVMNSLRKL